MRIVGVIPARYQSSRFPGKPLALINGKPMIWWVYHHAIQVKSIDDIYVATENELIYHTCEENGMKVLMTSDKHQTGTDRLGEVATLIDADFYINIQGDEPILEPETIGKLMDYYIAHPDVKVLNTMTLLQEEEDVKTNTIVKVVAAENEDLIYLSRSPIPYPKKGQQVAYYKHLGLYGISKDALLFFSQTNRTKNEIIEDIEMLRFLESNYKVKIIKIDSKTIGVDVPEDINKVERVLNRVNRGIQ